MSLIREAKVAMDIPMRDVYNDNDALEVILRREFKFRGVEVTELIYWNKHNKKRRQLRWCLSPANFTIVGTTANVFVFIEFEVELLGAEGDYDVQELLIDARMKVSQQFIKHHNLQ